MTISHSKPELCDSDIAAVSNALRASRLSQGEEVAELERELAAMHGEGYEAVVVASGTAALYLSLIALGLEQGNKVVIPSYTCNSLFSAVCHANGLPALSDVKEDSVCIGPDTIEPLHGEPVSAVIAPHTCGYQCDIAGIAESGIPVIEDCAQCIGGTHTDGAPTGTKGTIGIFSFYATKLVPAGEGGACITPDHAVAQRIRALRDCDEQAPDPAAFNFKMTDICAALARSRLKRLGPDNTRRAEIAARYDEAFEGASFRSGSPDPQPVCFRYLLRAEGRAEEIIERSSKQGIMCRRPVWKALHHASGDNCPNTTRLEEDLVSVPIYPGLADNEVDIIIDTLAKLL